MTTDGVIDDHVLARYRELLDQEDAAFNEVEHAFEDGDRAHFENDLALWRKAIETKISYLEKCGLSLLGPNWADTLPDLGRSKQTSSV